MKNRAILSRENAKGNIRKLVEVPFVQQKTKKDLGKIAMKDLETGKVVKEFESIEQAVTDGFNLPNIVGAIKGNKKYKGYLWSAENELT
jgi:hypothetical protein